MAPNRTELDRLAQRLTRYGLGLGAVVAAGIGLPQKADADIVYGSLGATVDSNSGVLYLRWPSLAGFEAGSSGCFTAGFNFELYCACSMAGFWFDAGLAGCCGFSILAVCNCGCGLEAAKWTYANTNIDLAGSFDTACYGWVTHTFQLTPLSLGTPVFVGLRMTDGSGSYHGWAELELGSLTINGSAFNNTDGGPIYPGEVPVIPEPSSLLLLLSGMAGLEALRRSRQG